MIQVCILINAEKVSILDVVKKLEKIPGVVETFPTFGRFDIVAFCEVEKREDVTPLIRNINVIEGVYRTESLIEL